jgi:hypothetical protein
LHSPREAKPTGSFPLTWSQTGAEMAIPPGSAQSIGNVHRITVNIVTLNEDVAEVEADPEIKPLFWRNEFVVLRLLLLDFDGAAKGVDHTAELDQYSIAHCFD